MPRPRGEAARQSVVDTTRTAVMAGVYEAVTITHVHERRRSAVGVTSEKNAPAVRVGRDVVFWRLLHRPSTIGCQHGTVDVHGVV